MQYFAKCPLAWCKSLIRLRQSGTAVEVFVCRSGTPASSDIAFAAVSNSKPGVLNDQCGIHAPGNDF